MILFRKNIKEIEYNQKNIDRYKNSSNMLIHARYIPNKTKGIMLIDRFNRLVGYIAWEDDLIIALEVSELYRGRGIATELIKKSKCTRLTVSKLNYNAINLYLNLGWKIVVDFGKT